MLLKSYTICVKAEILKNRKNIYALFRNILKFLYCSKYCAECCGRRHWRDDQSITLSLRFESKHRLSYHQSFKQKHFNCISACTKVFLLWYLFFFPSNYGRDSLTKNLYEFILQQERIDKVLTCFIIRLAI